MLFAIGTALEKEGSIVNPTRVDWEPGMAFIPPPGYWHARFNESKESARRIPIQDAGFQTYLRALDASLNEDLLVARRISGVLFSTIFIFYFFEVFVSQYGRFPIFPIKNQRKFELCSRQFFLYEYTVRIEGPSGVIRISQSFADALAACQWAARAKPALIGLSPCAGPCCP